MMQNKFICPKCKGEMEEGFILDKGDYASQQVSAWVEGEPHPSFWHGGVKVSDKRRYEVRSYRCVGCGYLESYAAIESE